jgi:hypothetical protein
VGKLTPRIVGTIGGAASVDSTVSTDSSGSDDDHDAEKPDDDD